MYLLETNFEDSPDKARPWLLNWRRIMHIWTANDFSPKGTRLQHIIEAQCKQKICTCQKCPVSIRYDEHCFLFGSHALFVSPEKQPMKTQIHPRIWMRGMCTVPSREGIICINKTTKHVIMQKHTLCDTSVTSKSCNGDSLKYIEHVPHCCRTTTFT